ncbi:MAG: hypothetical protein ACLP9L_31565 [Thermoguttaceae bacterium]
MGDGDPTYGPFPLASGLSVDKAHPAEFIGAHGKGLKQLGLRLDEVERD